jgi:type II secretory pathway predicted ATPase ExeA
LRESPFNHGLDPRFFYQSANHEEALARLDFLVDQPRRLGLLLGEPGVGKSLVFDVFGRQKRSATREVASLSLLGMTSVDFLWQVAVKLGKDPAPGESLFLLWRSVADQLAENRYQHKTTILLFDDADEASDEVLLQVARIAQLDPSPAARLTIALAAQSRRVGNLSRRLLELADLRVDLEAWQEDETAGYIHWALNRGGCTRNVFTPDAMHHLHELTDGLPRRVMQLADMALIAGAGCDLDQIDVDTIENVFHELGVTTTSRR